MIVEEYAKTGDPVGSKGLVEAKELEVSSATVRNEMANLVTNGYLAQPHTSAGRVPTTLGLRYYINNLMEEGTIPVLQEVAIKQRLWQERYELGKLLRQAVLALSELTKHMTIIVTEDGDVAHAGALYILDHPEFYDIDVTRKALSLLDDTVTLESLFSMPSEELDAHILIGEETQLENFADCGIVFSTFTTGNKAGTIAVIGPARMSYPDIVPAVKYLKTLLKDVSQT